MPGHDGLRFRVLGPVRFWGHGQWLSAGSPRLRALLALLLAVPGRPVSAETLVEELWPRTPPVTGVKPLQMYVSRLRCVLGDTSRQRLLTAPGGYQLRVSANEVDALLLPVMIRRARALAGRGDQAGVLDLLLPVLGLCAGRPFADATDSVRVSIAAAELDEHLMAALELRFRAELALGRHQAVLAELAAATARYPYHEVLCAQWMTALCRSARRPEALRGYDAFRARLACELQVQPSSSLRALERRIRDRGCA